MRAIRRLIRLSDGHAQEIAQGAAVAFGAKVAGAGLGFAFNVVIARELGAEGTGLYFLALACVTVASVIGRRGLDNTLLRLVASNASIRKWSPVTDAYSLGTKLALGASLVASVLLYLASPVISEAFGEPDLVQPVRIMSFGVVPLSMLMLHAECLKGLKLILQSQVLQGAATHLLVLLIFLMFGRFYGVVGAVSSYLSAVIITATLSAFRWQRERRTWTYAKGEEKAATLVKASLPLLGVGILNLLVGWTASVVLGAMATSSDVGVYNVAFRTAWLASFVLIAVNAIAAPKFAALFHQERITELRSVVVGAARLAAFLAIPVFGVLLFLPSLVMSLFGADFVDLGVPVLQILALAQLVNVLTGSVTYLLMMSGHEQAVFRCVLVASAIVVVLTVLLVPVAGARGAAIAALVSMSVQNALAVYFAWTRLRIWSMPFGAALLARGLGQEPRGA